MPVPDSKLFIIVVVVVNFHYYFLILFRKHSFYKSDSQLENNLLGLCCMIT